VRKHTLVNGCGAWYSCSKNNAARSHCGRLPACLCRTEVDLMIADNFDPVASSNVSCVLDECDDKSFGG